MGKHERQGSGERATADGASTSTAEGEALTAPTGPQASTIGPSKRPDPHWAPHETGKA
jgi:hypothetical protein